VIGPATDWLATLALMPVAGNPTQVELDDATPRWLRGKTGVPFGIPFGQTSPEPELSSIMRGIIPQLQQR
jgi:hypothetical protein